MKSFKILLILLLSIILIQCSLFDDKNYGARYFIFKNYTETDYTDTMLSLGQVEDGNIFIHYTENLGRIDSKGVIDYGLRVTKPTKKYDKVFFNFIKKYGDIGCFLFEFSDGRKLFIEVGYYGDFGDEINAANEYSVEITEHHIGTRYRSDTIDGIAVQDYEIIR